MYRRALLVRLCSLTLSSGGARSGPSGIIRMRWKRESVAIGREAAAEANWEGAYCLRYAEARRGGREHFAGDECEVVTRFEWAGRSVLLRVSEWVVRNFNEWLHYCPPFSWRCAVASGATVNIRGGEWDAELGSWGLRLSRFLVLANWIIWRWRLLSSDF